MLRLSSLFSDHAVMQREKFVRIWGWCAPNELVKLEFCGENLTVWSDETGAFFFLLPPQNAGGPHTMTVRCKDEVLQRTDIYFGEVYLAGGQSNMEMPLEGWPVPFPEEDLNSLRFQYPVRLFKVPLLADVRRHSDVNAKWLLPTRENYPEMSAVGTFFADMLSQALEIPVGIISCNWGGTIAEAWISGEALASNPDIAEQLANYERKAHEATAQQFCEELLNCDPEELFITELRKHHSLQVEDPTFPQAQATLDDSSWDTMQLPNIWQTALKCQDSGVIWFRKKVTIPSEWAGKPLQLSLGAIDKTDISFFNGIQVGAMGEEFDYTVWNIPRNYPVPAELSVAGEVVIAVRASSFRYGGGLTGPAQDMVLRCPEIGDEISISGEWLYQWEKNIGNVEMFCCSQLGRPNCYHMLFDSMLLPVIRYTMRGALYYQGESNASNYWQYQQLMEMLIADWRRYSGQADFSFYQTLLAYFGNNGMDYNWAYLRQAQINAARATDSYFVSAIDLGDRDDIHPLRKRQLAERFCNTVLATEFGKDTVFRYPEALTARQDVLDIQIILTESDGLQVRGDKIETLEAVDADGNVFPAEGEVSGSKLLVRCPAIKEIACVRYAWMDCPENANLYNGQGQPVLPFNLEVK